MNADMDKAELAALPNKALKSSRGIDGWRVAEFFFAGVIFLAGTGFLLYQSAQRSQGKVTIDMRASPQQPPPGLRSWPNN